MWGRPTAGGGPIYPIAVTTMARRTAVTIEANNRTVLPIITSPSRVRRRSRVAMTLRPSRNGLIITHGRGEVYLPGGHVRTTTIGAVDLRQRRRPHQLGRRSPARLPWHSSP